jgi:hypothetical protein
MTPPSLQGKKNTNLAYTAYTVRSAGGAKETPPRENQRVTRGDRQVPLCDLWYSFVLFSYEPPRMQFLSSTGS